MHGRIGRVRLTNQRTDIATYLFDSLKKLKSISLLRFPGSIFYSHLPIFGSHDSPGSCGDHSWSHERFDDFGGVHPFSHRCVSFMNGPISFF